VKIKYRKARIFYDYNHFDDAVVLSGHRRQACNRELAIYSANLLLDCLNIMGKYKELRLTVEKFLGNPVLMRTKSSRSR